MAFRREPVSAHQMVRLLAKVDLYALGPRARRLLLHWWRLGIENRIWKGTMTEQTIHATSKRLRELCRRISSRLKPSESDELARACVHLEAYERGAQQRALLEGLPLPQKTVDHIDELERERDAARRLAAKLQEEHRAAARLMRVANLATERAESDRDAARAEVERLTAQLTASSNLLADVAYHVVSVGGVDNHGHRTDVTACTECQLVNRLIDHVAAEVDAALAPHGGTDDG